MNIILVSFIKFLIKIIKYFYNFYRTILYFLKYKFFKKQLNNKEIYEIGVFFSKNKIISDYGRNILSKIDNQNIFYRKANFFLANSLFNKTENCPKKYFNNFFTNNRNIQDDFLNFYPPQVSSIIIDHNFNLDDSIFKIINENPTNSFSDNKQIKIYKYYQSEHNLHNQKDFRELTKFIEDYLNNNLIKYYFKKMTKGRFIINKMWFVKSRKGIELASHNHPEGVISGILYYKVPAGNDPGNLVIQNPRSNIIINSNIKNYKIHEKKIIIKPENNNLVVFNSYLEHSVNNQRADEYRISIPWDAEFEI